MDCKTEVLRVDADWTMIKNECRNTVNKEATQIPPKPEFKRRLLISEHSPIRLIRIQWRWASIKSWCATHFARHWLGWDKWIGTRRSDRTGVNRETLSQNELVPMDVCANAQALINVARFRLCRQASTETRTYMEDLKKTIASFEPELADVMVPNCVYRGGCPEFQPCSFWGQFMQRHKGAERLTIPERYRLYNEDFNGGVDDT